MRSTPDEQDLGAKNVSLAVPTTRCSSLFRSLNGNTANENAASFVPNVVRGSDLH